LRLRRRLGRSGHCAWKKSETRSAKHSSIEELSS
jgi:hypothetical protein